MEIPEIRRLSLINAMNAKCGGRQKRLADVLGKAPDYISRLLNAGSNGKRFSGDYARQIEEKLGLPPLWLDQPQNASSRALVPMVSATVVAVPVLEHKCHARADDFLGVALFMGDIQKASRELENLRAANIADGAMACARAMRGYAAVIDITARVPTDGDIYLIEHGNKLKLRRLMLEGRKWMARGDNPDDGRYPDIVIDDPNKQIVGQFVWGLGVAL